MSSLPPTDFYRVLLSLIEQLRIEESFSFSAAFGLTELFWSAVKSIDCLQFTSTTVPSPKVNFWSTGIEIKAPIDVLRHLKSKKFILSLRKLRALATPSSQQRPVQCS
ncbi:hypothetical protein TYRP_021322 [Tyrophagus putrescentiae]|nr:hypothetical protein TYRP_021322 [Tyrophagus putrescentiae]